MIDSEVVRIELRQLLAVVIDENAAKSPMSTSLTDAEVDSLSILEICEALGDRFHLVIPDERIDAIVTLNDIVDAVLETAADDQPLIDATPTEVEMSKRFAVKAFWILIVIGITIGTILGFTGTALFQASGLDNVTPLPSHSVGPLNSPSRKSSTHRLPLSRSPEPSNTTASLQVSSSEVSAGERFTLTGSLDVEPGTVLQVQRKDGTQWVNFPVTTTAKENGFSISIQTSRSGQQEFRVLSANGETTPSVMVTIR